MARARNIKPGFFESEDPAKVGYPQRLLWIALWTLAGREGRLEYRPATFKKYAFGFDAVTVEQVRDWVSELDAANLIDMYDVGSTQVIQVVNFHKHQRPLHHRRRAGPARGAAGAVRCVRGGVFDGGGVPQCANGRLRNPG